MGTTYRYASPGLHRVLLRVFMVLPTVVAIGFAFTDLSVVGKIGVVGTAVAITVYWYHLLYLRTVCRLELTDTELHWWTPKRDGAIPLADVRGFCMESQNAVVNADGHPRLFVHADPMLPAFLDTLRQVAPHVEVDPCLLAALDERFARGSAVPA
ncbi:hypothetical protein Val02_92930 [Virgisporangium aliadipatigenens]|uniref:Uncharacterized protein n=1 Tax=Virgisporangium aliadipatigenens TaxID=741659 RepID=A0A8J4DXT9_9ACTN|nr:hypothetical protein [Virgisporangium aliadipatigenens]GIJ52407.1 hypothetical protein Val02_92930 [Virgisporangium aliadipatigenens]